MHSTPLRILVVEDEPDIREMLVACLSVEAEVRGAVDGQEALELLEQGPMPSVILLDLRMPRLSGEEVLRALDHFPDRPPVVTMSACTPQPARGSAAHLEKPFAIEDALSVLHRVCLEAAPEGAAPGAPPPGAQARKPAGFPLPVLRPRLS